MENNNEIMNFEDIEVMDNIELCEDSGIGTGVAMLIGAGIAAAAGGVVVLAKKGIAAWKARKELNKPDKEIPAEELESSGAVVTK